MIESRKAYLIEITPGRFYRLTDTLGRMQTTEHLADAQLFSDPKAACHVSLLAQIRGKPAKTRPLSV